MAFTISPRPALDGSGATINGGVDFIDTSGVGTGPYIVAKCLIDPAGVNVQFVLSNNAAKCDISSMTGVSPVSSTTAESNHIIKASAGVLYDWHVTTGANSGYIM